MFMNKVKVLTIVGCQQIMVLSSAVIIFRLQPLGWVVLEPSSSLGNGLILPNLAISPSSVSQ